MITDEQRDTDTMERENAFFAGMARGSKDERNRIIVLLRNASKCTPARGHDYNGACYCDTIALIEGVKL